MLKDSLGLQSIILTSLSSGDLWVLNKRKDCFSALVTLTTFELCFLKPMKCLLGGKVMMILQVPTRGGHTAPSLTSPHSNSCCSCPSESEHAPGVEASLAHLWAPLLSCTSQTFTSALCRSATLFIRCSFYVFFQPFLLFSVGAFQVHLVFYYQHWYMSGFGLLIISCYSVLPVGMSIR